jgi:hypothetical protein
LEALLLLHFISTKEKEKEKEKAKGEGKKTDRGRFEKE